MEHSKSQISKFSMQSPWQHHKRRKLEFCTLYRVNHGSCWCTYSQIGNLFHSLFSWLGTVGPKLLHNHYRNCQKCLNVSPSNQTAQPPLIQHHICACMISDQLSYRKQMLSEVHAYAIQEISFRTQFYLPIYWKNNESHKIFHNTIFSLWSVCSNQAVLLNNTNEWCSDVDPLRTSEWYSRSISCLLYTLQSSLLLLRILFCLVQCHFVVSVSCKSCLL